MLNVDSRDYKRLYDKYKSKYLSLSSEISGGAPPIKSKEEHRDRSKKITFNLSSGKVIILSNHDPYIYFYQVKAYFLTDVSAGYNYTFYLDSTLINDDDILEPYYGNTITVIVHNIRYKLKDGITKDMLDWKGLSKNPNAVSLIEEELTSNCTNSFYDCRVDLYSLIYNPNTSYAVYVYYKLLKKNLNLLDISFSAESIRSLLEENPNALHLSEADNTRQYLLEYSITRPMSQPISMFLANNPRCSINFLELSKNPDVVNIVDSHTNADGVKDFSKNDIIWDSFSQNINIMSIFSSDDIKIIEKEFIKYIDIKTVIRTSSINGERQYPYTKITLDNNHEIAKAVRQLVAEKPIRHEVAKIMLSDYIYDRSPMYNAWYRIWKNLSSNPNAIKLLELESSFDMLHWRGISANPNAYNLLSKHRDKIDWSCLSLNSNPEAFKLLLTKPDEIDLYNLELNTLPAAVDYRVNLLIENATKDNPVRFSENLSANPSIFEIYGIYGIITFNLSTGEVKTLHCDDKYIYFHHVKAYFLTAVTPRYIGYCYCTFYLDSTLINDYEKLELYYGKTITVILKNSRYKLKDNITKDMLDWKGLSKNPNAISLIEEEFESDNCTLPHKRCSVDWSSLAHNPNAIHIIEKELKTQTASDHIQSIRSQLIYNPNAFHLLEADKDKQRLLINNMTVPNVIIYLENKPRSEIDFLELSKNPEVVNIVDSHTNADGVKDLSRNDIRWDSFSQNINIMSIFSSDDIKIIEKEFNEYTAFMTVIDASIINGATTAPYDAISLGAPSTFKRFQFGPELQLLRDKQWSRIWENLSRNPNAIKLLELDSSRKKMYDDQYKSEPLILRTRYREALSQNPNAFVLLSKNKKNINWKGLSLNSNPEAFKLLLSKPDEIDLNNLELNTLPAAVDYRVKLLKEKVTEYTPVRFSENLSANPSIFKIINKRSINGGFGEAINI